MAREVRLSTEGARNADLQLLADVINELIAARKGVPAWTGTRIRLASADAIMTREHDVYMVSGTTTLTLPPCEAQRQICVYRIGTGTVTVQVPTSSADTINGVSNKTIGVQWSGLRFVGVPSEADGVPATKWDCTAMTAV